MAKKASQTVKVGSSVLIDKFLFIVISLTRKHWKISYENLPNKKAKRKAKVVRSIFWSTPKHFKAEVKKQKGIVISDAIVKKYKKEGV